MINDIWSWLSPPIELSSLQERQSAHHIGAGKGEWVFDGAIHMALCSQMYDAIDLLILHQLIKGIKVADIHLHELVVGLILDVLEVSEITCIRELIKVDDVVFWVFVYKEAYNMASDEACTSSNYYVSFHFEHKSNGLNELFIYGKYLNLLFVFSLQLP